MIRHFFSTFKSRETLREKRIWINHILSGRNSDIYNMIFYNYQRLDIKLYKASETTILFDHATLLSMLSTFCP